MQTEFWKEKRIFITGHSGFKGSWLVRCLQLLGAHVCGYSLKPDTKPSLFELINLENDCQSHWSDISDYKALEIAIKNYQPDIVFHLAAQPLVRKSYADPRETFQTNVMGTVNLLEACSQVDSIKSIVVVTTDKCYENKEWHWSYRENEPLGGHDPYSASKACAEIVASSYRNSFLSKLGQCKDSHYMATARAGNVIGGGDWSEDRLITDIIKAFSNEETLEIRSPNAIRPWQHVLDAVSGYLLLAQKLYENGNEYASAWNFGPYENDMRPVVDIVNQIDELWHHPVSWKVTGSQDLHEAGLLKLDCAKAHNLLNWQPKWNLEQAILHTTQWYQHWLQGADVNVIMDQQIEHYLGDVC